MKKEAENKYSVFIKAFIIEAIITAVGVLVFAVIFLVYLLSYFYTFEAYYSMPDATETISITDNTSYFIQNEDGSYDLYYSNIYFETVTDLNYFPDDIPIYTREEFEQLSFQ